MKSIILYFVLALVIVQTLAVIAPMRALNMDADKLGLSADLSTVSYSEENNRSSFEVDIKIKNSNVLYVVVSDISYKLSFKDKNGELLSEKILDYPQSLTETNNEITLTFEAGELGYINGMVNSVDAEIVSFEVVNKVAAENKAIGFGYALDNPLIFVYAISSILFCCLCSLASEIKNFIVSVIGMLISFTIAYACAMLSTSTMVLAFLA